MTESSYHFGFFNQLLRMSKAMKDLILFLRTRGILFGLVDICLNPLISILIIRSLSFLRLNQDLKRWRRKVLYLLKKLMKDIKDKSDYFQRRQTWFQ